jgi:WD40 repeat protein
MIGRNGKIEWVDCAVHVWDAKTRKELRRWEHTRPVHCLAFFADGQHVIAGDDNGKVRIWDMDEKPDNP